MGPDQTFRTTSRHAFNGALLAFGALALLGCASVGPNSVRIERNDYNRAVTETQEEELLLNLVRTRYMRGLAFLQISSISSSIGVEASAGGVVGISDAVAGTTATGALTYSDRPTIIYQPVVGQEFVRQLLKPLALRSLSLIIDGGYHQSDVFREFVERLNGVPNARSAADVTAKQAPEFETFRELVDLIEVMSDRGDFLIGRLESSTSGDEIQVFIVPEGKRSPEGRRLMSMLKLDPSVQVYRMLASKTLGGGDVIAIDIRSVAGSVLYLSKGVEVPEGDQDEVFDPLDENGAPYDWSRLLKGLFRIESSATEPSAAAISVNYRGRWFYIDERDVESKETSALLSTVLRLQAGGGEIEAPVLTLPVSRN